MFERYIFRKDSCKNVVKEKEVLGFEVKTYVSYYRSVPLSMIHKIEVTVDGVKSTPEDILFTPDQKEWFTFEEMKTAALYKWEYGDEATIFVKKPGGLPQGHHQVKLEIAIRTPYVPVPFGGAVTRNIVI
jgi:hypothetical protein